MEIEFQGEESTVEIKTEPTEIYELSVKVVTEEVKESEDNDYLAVRRSMSSLLEDRDIDMSKLPKSLRRKVKEGAEPIPHSRQEVTEYIIQEAVNALKEELSDDYELLELVDLKVVEKQIVREMAYEDTIYGK